MTILIAAFSITLTGIAFADYGGEDIFDTPFADIEQDTRADARGDQTPANNPQEVINPHSQDDSQSGEHGDVHEEKFNATDYILEHISDSHGWHILTKKLRKKEMNFYLR